MTNGAIRNYEIWERGRKKANSQTRGIIALDLPDLLLKPGESYSLEWHIFAHNGNDDFAVSFWKKGVYLYLAINMCLRKERKPVWNVGVWNL